MTPEELASGIRYKRANGHITLFHGSKSRIDGPIVPDYKSARSKCDFGQGFYMNTIEEQAKMLICRRNEPQIYTLDFDLMNLRCVHLNGLAWALFTAYKRGFMNGIKGQPLYKTIASIEESQDVIVGPIADDKMFDTMEEFFESGIKSTPLLACMRGVKLGTQYTAVTKRACEQIKILKEETIPEEERAKLIIARDQTREHALVVTKDAKRRYRDLGEYFDDIMDNWGDIDHVEQLRKGGLQGTGQAVRTLGD